MKLRVLKLAALLALSVLALAACPDAILATIDTAQKTATNTLFQTIFIYDIAVPAPASYYVAAGRVFQGTLNGTTVTWNPDQDSTAKPWNPPGLVCNAMTLFSGNLYGGFFASDGTPSLWQSSVGPNYSFASGTELTMQSTGEQVTGLSTDGANLFVSGAVMSGSNFVFQLEYSPTPGTEGIGTWQSVMTGKPYPVLPVAFDGTNYWTASGATLYESASGLGGFSPVAGNWGTINGVFADASNVVVCTKTNGVFYYNGTWHQVQPDHQGTVTVSYLCSSPAIASGIYLIGSDGYGYYTLNTSNGTLSRYGDSTTVLYTAAVSRIVLDNSSGNHIVLMGTYSKGLWRTVYDPLGGSVPASGQSWINE